MRSSTSTACSTTAPVSRRPRSSSNNGIRENKTCLRLKNDEFRKNDITLTSPAAKSTCWTRREMVVRFIIEE
nr:MAG TPA: hypothetical protein [Caudoviricetes sp.]